MKGSLARILRATRLAGATSTAAQVVREIRYGSADSRAIQQLENSSSAAARRIGRAARLATPNPAIERERRRLANDRRPLVDGTLASNAPFDLGGTISDACAVSKRVIPAAFLSALVREFDPAEAIELGTNVGISSAYIAEGLQRGTLKTLEASPYRIRIAREMHERLGLSNIQYVQGLFDDTLSETLDRMERVDFAFIDGHHQYQPTLDYFEAILARASLEAVFVFDDIRWSEGMKRAWATLSQHPKFAVVVDFSRYGVCVLGRGHQKRLFAGPIHTY